MRIDFVLKNIGSPPVFSIVIVIEIPEPPRASESIDGLVLRDSPDVLALQHTLMGSLHIPSSHTQTSPNLRVSIRDSAKTSMRPLHAMISR